MFNAHRQGGAHLQPKSLPSFFLFVSKSPIKMKHSGSLLAILSAILGLLANLVTGHGGHHDEGKAMPNKDRLLILSLDGFRYNFLDRGATPNMAKIYQSGVRAASLQSSYITKTFPNHYTLVTGLYEESHGIIANTMLNVSTGATFDHCSNPKCGVWYQGQPVWQTNQFGQHNSNHDKKPYSGVIYWPGTGAEINGVNVTHEIPFKNNGLTLREKFEQVLEWFMDSDEPLNLGIVYHHEPDATCHHAGPDSANVTEMLRELDGDIGFLLSELEEHKLSDINLVLLSDHGFANINGTIALKEDCHVNITDAAHYLVNSPVISIWPQNETQRLEFKQKLEDCAGVQVYEKGDEELVKRHYNNNSRIGPLIVTSHRSPIGEDNAQIVTANSSDIYEDTVGVGDHGWNNSWKAMHGFFIARGLAFKRGYQQETFSNINTYSLFCHILGVKPAPNNGSLETIKHMLSAEQAENAVVTLVTIVAVALVCALVSGMIIIGLCRLGNKTTPYHSGSISNHNGQMPEQSSLLMQSRQTDSSDDEF